MIAFTFDFKSLYDDLKPDVVKKALQHAIQTGLNVNKRERIMDRLSYDSEVSWPSVALETVRCQP